METCNIVYTRPLHLDTLFAQIFAQILALNDHFFNIRILKYNIKVGGNIKGKEVT